MAIILVGSGGFAQELLFWLQSSAFQGEILGYLGQKNDALAIPYLGSIEEHTVSKEAKYLLAIGLMQYRRSNVELLKSRGASFSSFIHSHSLVALDARLGEGCVIGPHCVVSAGAVLGDFVFVNNYACVGHHAQIADHCALSPFAAVSGGCYLGHSCQMGTHSTLLPKVKVQEAVRIAPGAVVFKSNKPNVILSGNPAREIAGI